MSIIFSWTFPEGRGIALIAGVALLIACGPSKDPEAPSAAPPLALSRPMRVVSLSAASSQFLLALGAGDQIIGVDGGSSGIPELSGLPVVDLAGASQLDPDLILMPATPTGQEPRAEELRSAGYEVLVFEPHSLDEAFALCRDLGARLVGTPRARAFENALARELASIGGASFGRPRPRVAGVIGPAPLEFAGGHSYVTDLIEIAGGSSVTHGGAELRMPMRADLLRSFAPDLLLVVSPGELAESERRAIQQALPAAYRVDFFVFDADRVWTHEVVEAALRLRALIEPLSDELERTTLRPAGPEKDREGGG